MKKFNTFDAQLGESVVLTDKAKLSLYKKSQNSGYSIDILEEVYRRGHFIWNESFGGTPDSFAFDRVNSFISGGFAAQLDEDLLDEKRGLWDNIHAKRARIKAGSGEHMRKPGSKGAPTDAAIKASQNEDTDPCWKGYKQIGMKNKNGRKVPNCVPVKEQLNQPTPSAQQIAKKHDVSLASVNSAIAKGKKVESEHTKSSKNAAEIARDHLGERPDYYKKLAKMEKSPMNEERLNHIAELKASLFEFVESYSSVDEATFQGKKVPLNKPMKGDVKKSKVYVDPDGDGKAQKVNFGDKNMSIKKDQPGRKKSYCARSGGIKGTSDKTSANYWSRKAWNCSEETLDEVSHKLALKAMKKSEKRADDEYEADQAYDRLSDYKTHEDRAKRLRGHMRKKFGNDKPGRGNKGGDKLGDNNGYERTPSDRLTHGKRAGLPSRQHISNLKSNIKSALGKHTKANLPEETLDELSREAKSNYIGAVKDAIIKRKITPEKSDKHIKRVNKIYKQDPWVDFKEETLDEKTSDIKRKAVQMALGRRHKQDPEFNTKMNPATAALKLGRKLQKKGVNEDAEKHSKNPDNPMSRFDGSNELTAIYKKDTPGQDKK